MKPIVTLSGDLWLKPEHFNSAGNNPYDGAASLSNIRDTCYGNQVIRNQRKSSKTDDICWTLTMQMWLANFEEFSFKAKRSSYGVAPGGCVCLKEKMLEAMFEYAMLYHGQTGQAIQVS